MAWIERQWQVRNLVTLALRPFAALFGGLIRVRRRLYHSGLLKVRNLSVPVVVVGNISVGGTGKTPLIIWLCHLLRARGMHPGIVSRGYGGNGRLQEVTPRSGAVDVGDEPLLLARRCQVPVYVSPDRVSAAEALLRQHPMCDVILSDDGLQHYALPRQVEIAVVDGARGFGNGLLLPAGPLREPVARLADVDAVVRQGEGVFAAAGSFAFSLAGERFARVQDPSITCTAQAWRGRTVHAVAGIGHPERFFIQLESLGLHIVRHAFRDHHAYTAADFDFAGSDIVLMTEKDAVKCVAFARPDWWYLPVDAVVDPALGDLILAKLRERHGF